VGFGATGLGWIGLDWWDWVRVGSTGRGRTDEVARCPTEEAMWEPGGVGARLATSRMRIEEEAMEEASDVVNAARADDEMPCMSMSP
jgi:hypothetical protein